MYEYVYSVNVKSYMYRETWRDLSCKKICHVFHKKKRNEKERKKERKRKEKAKERKRKKITSVSKILKPFY